MPDTPVVSTSAKPKVEPLINEQADKVLRGILIRGGLITIVTMLIVMVIISVIYQQVFLRYPHSVFVTQYQYFSSISIFIWMVPFYLTMQAVATERVKMGRQFVAEERWTEAYGALETFSQFGQRSFDRTGEANYLLALAMDKTGRKKAAEKVRDFIRKHRAGSEWAKKVGGSKTVATPSGPAISASQLRKSTTLTAANVAAEADNSKRKPMPSKNARRRRF